MIIFTIIIPKQKWNKSIVGMIFDIWRQRDAFKRDAFFWNIHINHRSRGGWGVTSLVKMWWVISNICLIYCCLCFWYINTRKIEVTQLYMILTMSMSLLHFIRFYFSYCLSLFVSVVRGGLYMFYVWVVDVDTYIVTPPNKGLCIKST